MILRPNYTKQRWLLTTKTQLSKFIVTNDYIPDYLAKNIYWDTSKPYYKSKHLIKKYVKLVKVEKSYLISWSFEHNPEALTQVNQINLLIIYHWKDTRHFSNSYGIDRKIITHLSPYASLNPYTSNKYIRDYTAEEYNVTSYTKTSNDSENEISGGSNV